MSGLLGQTATTAVNNKNFYKNFIKNIPLFSQCTDDALSKILDNVTVNVYKKDRLLFFTGDKAKFFYIILNGWVKLYRETYDGHESVISVLTKGELFGKAAILPEGSYAYTAEVISDTALLKISTSFLLYMAEDQVQFKNFLIKMMESDLHEINRLYLETEHLSKMTSAERLGYFLLKLCKGQQEGSVTFRLPYEKSLVAGQLGMTPETFSRSLNQLARIGVKTKNMVVTIYNIARLRAYICEHCSVMDVV